MCESHIERKRNDGLVRDAMVFFAIIISIATPTAALLYLLIKHLLNNYQ